MTSQDLRASIVKDAHRRLMRWMDPSFGVFFLALSSLIGIAAYLGKTSWHSFAFEITFPIANLVLSQVALRASDPKGTELFRAGVNLVMAPLAYLWVDGVFEPFWINCLCLMLATPLLATIVTFSHAMGSLATVLVATGMFLAALLGKKEVNWYGFAALTGFGMLMGVFISRMIGTLLDSMAQQVVRARDLQRSQQIILDQQQAMVSASKMSALGEMAGGLAHEINNPLTVIKVLSHQLQKVVVEEPANAELVGEMSARIETTTNRIARIVQGLRTFSRDGSADPFCIVYIRDLIDETLSFCGERFRNNGTHLIVEEFEPRLNFEGRQTEISQVLLNLLNNANDAVAERLESEDKWVKISVVDRDKSVEIQITDSGPGIPPEMRDKIFQPFFTTKGIGKGTGMGLSISSGIVRNHNGELLLDGSSPNTRFAIQLPKRQNP